MLKLISQYSNMPRSTYVIFISRVINNMGAFIWPLLTLILSVKMGYSATTIAFLSMMIGLIFLPANIIGGKLADKYNRKTLIVVFSLISAVFFIACGFIEPSNTMTALFVLAGLFSNISQPAFDALIADCTTSKDREKAFSLSYLGHNLGFIVGAAVGGMLFENYLNLAFILDAATTIIATVFMVLLVHPLHESEISEDEVNEYESNEEAHVTGLKVLLDRKSILFTIFAGTIAGAVYDQWGYLLPLYMADIFQSAGSRYFGLVASFNGLIVIIFTPILTLLFSKWFELKKMFLGGTLFAISYLLVLGRPPLYMFFIMMLIFTFGEIINMLGVSPFLSRRVPASHRGRLNSYRNIGYFIGGTAGRIGVGLLIDKASYTAAFVSLAIFGFMSASILIFTMKIDKATYPKLYGLIDNEITEHA